MNTIIEFNAALYSNFDTVAVYTLGQMQCKLRSGGCLSASRQYCWACPF